MVNLKLSLPRSKRELKMIFINALKFKFLKLIKKERIWLILIIIGGFLVRYLLRWELLGYVSDSYEYAMGAREIASSGRYLIQIGDLSFPPHYPIGLSLLIAPFFKILGSTDQVAIFAIVIMGTLGILVTYFLSKMFLDVKGVIIACVLVAFYPYLVFLSGVVMSDIPAMFFVTLAIFGLLKGIKIPHYFILSSICAAASFLLRPYLALFILPAFGIYLLMEFKDIRNLKSFFYILLSALIVTLPLIYQVVYVKAKQGSPFYPLGTFQILGTKYILGNLLTFSRFALFPNFTRFHLSYRYNLDQLIPLSCIVIYLYFIGIYSWYRGGRKSEAFLFLLIPALAFILHIFYFWPDPRFFIPYACIFILPAAGVLSRYLIFSVGLIKRLKDHKQIIVSSTQFYKRHIAILLIIVLISSSLIYFYLPAFIEKICVKGQGGYWQKDACIWAKENTEKDAVLITNIAPSLVGFYAERTVIPISYIQPWVFPEKKMGSIADKITGYQNSNRITYLLLERSINWSEKKSKSLCTIINTFNLTYLTHTRNFQIYEIKFLKPTNNITASIDSSWVSFFEDFMRINWYNVASISQWIEKNTEKESVIVTNLFPFMKDFFISRPVIPLSGETNLISSNSIDKHIVEKIGKYKEIQRPVYLVLYPYINWSPEVTENIYKIITNFDIDLVLEKSTDWSSELSDTFYYIIERFNIHNYFQSFLSKFHIPQLSISQYVNAGNLMIYEIKERNIKSNQLANLLPDDNWQEDAKWLLHPVLFCGLDNNHNMFDFWLLASSLGYEMSWKKELDKLPLKWKFICFEAKTDSPLLFWRLTIHYANERCSAAFEGKKKLKKWQKFVIPCKDSDNIEKLKIYIEAPKDGLIYHLYIKNIEFIT